jgi:predicted acylesterase/phospholipase RssA
VDGGVVQNTPIRPAIEEGADEIHVVSLNAKMAPLQPNHLENTLETFSRVYTAMLSANIDDDIATARWVNEGVEVMERVEAGEDLNSGVLARFVRVAGVIYKRLHQEGKLPRTLTIHRYFPDESLGDIFGMLNFHTNAVEAMISAGYSDAIAHDCEANGCVVSAAARKGLKRVETLSAAGA